jgi:putative ABC transport system permease protein
MMSRLALWLSRRVVRMAAVLLPPARRTEWRREWDAELQHESMSLQRRDRSWQAHVRLVRRAFGALPDAAWLFRQFTLDADAVHDASHGVRLLIKRPGFTVVALLIFAVGIGATTAIVSVADALFMRPLVVTRPDRVMTVWQYNTETGTRGLDVTPANAIDWIARARSFEVAAMAEPFSFNMNFAGRDPDYLTAARVTEPFFAVIGTPALLGRTFTEQEFRRGGPRVVLFSHALWTTRFGSDPAIVGRSVRLDPGDPYTVVGVMPPLFELRLFNDRARRPEPLAWLPKQGFDDVERSLRTQAFWNVLGRLRPGVSVEQAQSEFDALSAQLAREYPATNARIMAEVVPLRQHLVGSLRDVLPLLLGAAAILLCVACANVANLLLARAATRGKEFAIRQALGANRLRLIRQMLTESVLLAAAGGAVGLLFARWALDVIATLRPRDIALLDRIPIDARAAAIASGVTIAAALLAGLMPALQLARPDAATVLRDGRIESRRRLRSALVVAEVAAALMLTVGAGLLVRSFALIQRVDPGFTREQVSVVQVFATRRLDTPPKRIVFYQQVLDRLRRLPGVTHAGGITSMPFGEARVLIRGPLSVSGRPPASGEQALAYMSAVTGEYFQAMGVPLIKGRFFDATDTATSRHVVVVSRSAAQQFWPGADPIGSRLQFRFTGNPIDAEVVGIVGDVRREALDRPAAPDVFLPYVRSGFYGLTFVVCAAPGSAINLQTLKEQIWAVDPLQPIYAAAPLEALVSKTLTSQRFNLFVLGRFALATLILAVAGVYGVMSFSTSQRTREFGVRLALGAGRGDILRLVLREGLTLAGIGVLVGVLTALPLVRLLRALLFGITATDPVTFVSVGVGLFVVAALACAVPARKALDVDPVEALRFD